MACAARFLRQSLSFWALTPTLAVQLLLVPAAAVTPPTQPRGEALRCNSFPDVLASVRSSAAKTLEKDSVSVDARLFPWLTNDDLKLKHLTYDIEEQFNVSLPKGPFRPKTIREVATSIWHAQGCGLQQPILAKPASRCPLKRFVVETAADQFNVPAHMIHGDVKLLWALTIDFIDSDRLVSEVEDKYQVRFTDAKSQLTKVKDIPALLSADGGCTVSQARLHALNCADNRNLLPRVLHLVTVQLGVELAKVLPDSSFRRDLGGDDMDVAEVLMSLEQEFKVKIPVPEADTIRTPAEGVAAIIKLRRCEPARAKRPLP